MTPTVEATTAVLKALINDMKNSDKIFLEACRHHADAMETLKRMDQEINKKLLATLASI